jgi:hypothetical protein
MRITAHTNHSTKTPEVTGIMCFIMLVKYLDLHDLIFLEMPEEKVHFPSTAMVK